ncbi:FAD-dependent oxidoreductase [Cupriavidus basilensis]|nr:FAD-dependent oxidoreductase [Cupriavidus basilensis]
MHAESNASALRPLPDGKLSLDLRGVEAGDVGDAGTARQTLTADRVLVSAGVASAALLRPLGLRLPLYPVKGYSATVQVSDELQAPLGALMDESYKVAITRMGNRVRIAGTAELGSRKLDLRPAAINTLLKVARDWFPVMACGSGRIAADLIAGNRPGIDLDGLTPDRYGLGPR